MASRDPELAAVINGLSPLGVGWSGYLAVRERVVCGLQVLVPGASCERGFGKVSGMVSCVDH